MTTLLRPRLHTDFETRSPVDIEDCGGWFYARHPQTEVICLSYAFHGDEPICLTADQIRNGHYMPAVEKFKDGKKKYLTAHQAHFEYAVYNYILVPRYGYPELLDPAFWDCTMARGLACGFPKSLENLLLAINAPIQKDMAGRVAMMKISRPLGIDPLGDPYYREEKDFPDLFEATRTYCNFDVKGEMIADERLPELSAEERKVFEHDLVVNRRGVLIDVRTAAKAQHLAVEMMGPLNDRLKEITVVEHTKKKGKNLITVTEPFVEKATQIQRIKTFLAEHCGLQVDSLDKHAIEGLLNNPEIKNPAREIISIRQQANKSSTAKYGSMLSVADLVDQRARGLLQYWGAATGRWAGKLIQPHNFPKGLELEGVLHVLNENLSVTTGRLQIYKSKEQAEIIAEVMTMEPEQFAAKYGVKAAGVLGAILRGMIVASPGKVLVVADFAAIEARVLLWLAGDEAALETFRRGGSLYIEMAEYLFNRPGITKKDESEYGLGKKIILGCFAPDTLVLTERGWQPILNISTEDRVWDGEEWVNHGGVIDQGEKEVVNLSGVSVTPDHLFLTQEGRWISAAALLESGASLASTIATASSMLPDTNLVREEGFSECGLGALAATNPSSTSQISEQGNRHGAIPAPKNKLLSGSRTTGGTRLSSLMTPTEPASLTESRQRYSGATIQKTEISVTMEAEESSSSGRGERTGRNSFDISSAFRGGMTQVLRWTGLKTVVDTFLGISASLLGRRTWGIGDRSPSSKRGSSTSKQKLRVYDILCAGPRSRFTILTDAGPLIAHNCGYQMAGPKFQASCAQDGIYISEGLSNTAVKAYREKHKAVVALWYETQRAAIAAIREPGTLHKVAGGRVAYGMSKDRQFLICRLPSGRFLRYYRPTVEMTNTPWGEKPEIRYWCADVKGGLSQFKTYGGSLVENYVQAISRDLMVGGMLRTEAVGYDNIMTCHDEVAAEVDENEIELGTKSLDHFIETMCEVPPWATGAPITAEGYVAHRYRK